MGQGLKIARDADEVVLITFQVVGQLAEGDNDRFAQDGRVFRCYANGLGAKHPLLLAGYQKNEGEKGKRE